MQGVCLEGGKIESQKMFDFASYVASSPILLKLHDYLGRSQEIRICNIYNWLEIFLQFRKKKLQHNYSW